MNSNELTQKYLELLESHGKKVDSLVWYKTLLANKHRFYPSTEKLLNLINNKPITHQFQKSQSIKKSLFFLIKFGYELILIKKANVQKIAQWKKESDLNIIKTFSYDHSFKMSQFNDPFLGPLAEALMSQQLKVVIIHEHLGNFNHYLNQQHNDQLIHLFAFINWKDYFKEYFQLLKNIIIFSHSPHENPSQFIENNISEEKLTPPFLLHGLQFVAFKEMFAQLKIKKVFSIFENNGWEKMLLLAKQASLSKALIIAHQHVPIAPSALNYYLTKQDFDVLPDKIVTIGKVLKQFLKDLGYPEEKLVAGCALRLKLQTFPPPAFNKPTALIALDGIPQAAVALNSILKNKDFFKEQGWTFIIRFHPLFNEEKMAPFLIESIPTQNIFEISKLSLEEDIKRSQYVFYWGSTVAFEAMYSGRVVIHTPGNEILSNDPITQNGGLHFIAQDMIPTIQTIQSMTDENWEQRKTQSRVYCEEYFGVMNAESMKAFTE